MGDRCYLQCGVAPECVKDMEDIVELIPQPGLAECGKFMTMTDDQANYGSYEDLENAAKVGLIFYGYNSHGDEYSARKFASDGDGELYFVKCLEEEEGTLSPVVGVGPSGEADPEFLHNVRKCLGVYNRVKALAFPSEEEGNFGVMLEARLDCLDNDTVMQEMALYDLDNVGMLLDYIRLKKPDVKIINHFPEQDSVAVVVDDTSIKVWKDEHGDTHIHVCDPDGSCHDIVLGREDFTQKL